MKQGIHLFMWTTRGGQAGFSGLAVLCRMEGSTMSSVTKEALIDDQVRRVMEQNVEGR